MFYLYVNSGFVNVELLNDERIKSNVGSVGPDNKTADSAPFYRLKTDAKSKQFEFLGELVLNIL